MEASNKKSLMRLLGFSIYVLIGGAVFMQIEKEKDENAVKLTFEDNVRQWMKIYNMSEENITQLLHDYQRSVRENEQKPTWSFINSIYFVLQLVTTIGYGNITPVTPGGQIFTIVYAIVGIPVTLLALQSIGILVNIGLRVANRPWHRKFHSIHCREETCNFLEKFGFCISLVCFILTWVVVSAVSAHLQPEQSVVAVVYSIFVTYSTVGFGDIIPFEEHKYVFIITVLPGLSFLSSTINSLVTYMEKSSMLGKRCFDCPSCLATKRKARTKTDGIQDTEKDTNEHPMCNIHEDIYETT